MYSETLSKDQAVLSDLLEQDDATESDAIEMEEEKTEKKGEETSKQGSDKAGKGANVVENFDIEDDDLVNSVTLYEDANFKTKGYPMRITNRS